MILRKKSRVEEKILREKKDIEEITLREKKEESILKEKHEEEERILTENMVEEERILKEVEDVKGMIFTREKETERITCLENTQKKKSFRLQMILI